MFKDRRQRDITADAVEAFKNHGKKKLRES